MTHIPSAIQSDAWRMQIFMLPMRREDKREPYQIPDAAYAVLAAKRARTENMILAHIRKRPGIYTVGIAESIGMTDWNTNKVLRRMEKDGMVRMEKDGRMNRWYLGEI